MGCHGRRTRFTVRLIIAVLTAVLGAGLGGLVAGMPAYASASSDLSVKLSNKTDVKPGHRITYKITVHNAGPSTAEKVQAELVTTVSLSSIEYTISSGRCIRSAKETACLFGALKSGKTATATVSGVLSKKLKKGAAVNGKVTVLSDTHLTHTGDDVATDDYQVGIPRPVAAPIVPLPSASTGEKIAKIEDAASTAIKVTDRAFVISLIAIAAAILWFGIGLTLRRRSRRRRA